MPNDKISQKLINADIDGERYKELIHFSRQYEKKIAKINSFYGVSATKITGLPSAHSNSSSVENAAEKILKLRSDTDLIEKCVHIVCKDTPGMYPYLLKAVTQGVSYEKLLPPCTRRIFYEYRRKYFIFLDNIH